MDCENASTTTAQASLISPRPGMTDYHCAAGRLSLRSGEMPRVGALAGLVVRRLLDDQIPGGPVVLVAFVLRHLQIDAATLVNGGDLRGDLLAIRAGEN